VKLDYLAHKVILAWGWRRSAIAAFAGAMSALALAPLEIWPILFVTFPVAVWLIDGAGSAQRQGLVAAASAGWWFGFGYFLAGLYWVGYAFLVDAKTFGWLLPFAVLALPAGLAVFTAFGFALARALWGKGAARILTIAAALTLAEWLRGHVLTGFPWNAFGEALAGPLPLAQTAALVGLWGMTFLAVALFAAPAVLADDPADTRRRWLPPAAAVATLAILLGHGAWRVAANPTAYVGGVRLRIMQPNLPQDAKFNYGAKRDVMQRYVGLSDRAVGPQASGLAGVTHLIWPESAFPFFLNREPDALAEIAALLPPGTTLITGGARVEDTTGDRSGLRAYNSIYVVSHEGTILSIYDKVHLVPFGEYLPFQTFLERLGLIQLTKMPGGFLSGDRRRALDVPPGPRFLPLICYEVIFPGAAVPDGERPGWLVNLTNDAWFGISSGPYQHFQQARLRAIEEGLPLVRSANNGISAVVDPVGRIIRSLPLGTEGVIDSPLPQAMDRPFYRRVGDVPLAILIVLLLARSGLSRTRRRNEKLQHQVDECIVDVQ
jgi:apolipoprotein N-acyltransferase